MSQQHQPPAGAVADLPVAAAVVGAFASVAGQLGLVARAAKGAAALLAATVALSLVLPASGAAVIFLVLVGFAATAHFGLNWCRVMLLGPAGLPAHSLAWRPSHWRFFGYGLLLLLVMLLSTLPMTALGSIIAGVLGLAGPPGQAGAQMAIALLLVCLGVIYVVARLGFIFPAVAVEETYSLRLAWQHTAGQGARLAAALFAVGFPITIAQMLLMQLLSQGLLGMSPAEMLPTLPEPGAGPPSAGTTGAEPSPALAIVLSNAIAAAVNLLSFAVLFSLLSLAFRTCTGWVPAAGGNLPSVPEEDKSDADDAGR